MKETNRELFYVGTFSEYLYVMELDIENEEMKMINRIEGARRPAYLSLSKGREHLYAANEIYQGSGGGKRLRFRR